MDCNTIVMLAKRCGLDIYGPIRLVKVNDEIAKFTRDMTPTIFGCKLISFAIEIEKEVKKENGIDGLL